MGLLKLRNSVYISKKSRHLDKTRGQYTQQHQIHVISDEAVYQDINLNNILKDGNL